MSAIPTTALPKRMDGYVAVPMDPSLASGPLRICLMVREQPDSAGSRLVLVRMTTEARVLLGCLLDAAGGVHQWLEVWFQQTETLAQSPLASQFGFTNSLLFDRWQRQLATYVGVDSSDVVQTGWEAAYPPPLVIDRRRGVPVAFSDTKTGEPWVLCGDDALLAKRGLPAFSTSLHRYLMLAGRPDGPMLAATTGAPLGTDVTSAASYLAQMPDCEPVNLACGLIMVRGYQATSYEAFLALLTEGTMDQAPDMPPAVVAQRTLDGQSGFLFPGRHGRAGRLVEGFHLRLRLLRQAAGAVQQAVETLKRPLLGLSAASFRGEFASTAAGLPFLWTYSLKPTDLGAAAPLRLVGVDSPLFGRAEPYAPSVYVPTTIDTAAAGRGSALFRHVTAVSETSFVIEGTLHSADLRTPGRAQLTCIHLALSGKPLVLYGRVEPDTSLPPGNWRFRTLKQAFAPEVAAEVARSTGVNFLDCRIETIPLLGAAHDLYALGVLAIRTLLVNTETTVPTALDTMLGLASLLAQSHDPAQPLRRRIADQLQRDVSLLSALGPQRLTNEQMSAKDALDLIPGDLWCDALGLIVGMLPGQGPDSSCRDFGDASTTALHRTFDRAVQELDSLVLRSRSLLLIDWRFNREIHTVIRQIATGIGPA